MSVRKRVEEQLLNAKSLVSVKNLNINEEGMRINSLSYF